jgi:putative FmdB family regulatory protein
VPTYEYKCSGCPMTVTITRSVESVENKPICANCAVTMTRIYDAPPIQFRGKGWGKD